MNNFQDITSREWRRRCEDVYSQELEDKGYFYPDAKMAAKSRFESYPRDRLIMFLRAHIYLHNSQILN